MKYPKVSVIIPCYNTGDLINETFESLENQTNKDFEVIFINDGSNDDTLLRLCEFQKNSPLSISIIDKKNAGVSAARNDGIRSAKGEYLVFLDSDDVFHKDFIACMLGTAESLNVDTVYCKLTRDFQKLSNEDNAGKIETADEAMNRLLYKMGEYGFCCYIYRADLLRKYGITFEEGCKYGEDREFIWKYMIHCQSFANINSVLYGYRENPDSATKRKATWARTDSLHTVKRVEHCMQENKIAFYDTYKDYMYARDMWAVAKCFAITSSKENYKRLINEFDVRSCMRRMIKDDSKAVSIAAVLYCLRPMFFYYAINVWGKLARL